MVSILRASVVHGSRFVETTGPMELYNSDFVRLASTKDFDKFRVSFKGYDNGDYEFKN